MMKIYWCKKKVEWSGDITDNWCIIKKTVYVESSFSKICLDVKHKNKMKIRCKNHKARVWLDFVVVVGESGDFGYRLNTEVTRVTHFYGTEQIRHRKRFSIETSIKLLLSNCFQTYRLIVFSSILFQKIPQFRTPLGTMKQYRKSMQICCIWLDISVEMDPLANR